MIYKSNLPNYCRNLSKRFCLAFIWYIGIYWYKIVSYFCYLLEENRLFRSLYVLLYADASLVLQMLQMQMFTSSLVYKITIITTLLYKIIGFHRKREINWWLTLQAVEILDSTDFYNFPKLVCSFWNSNY